MSDPDDAKPVKEEATWANGCSVCQSKGEMKFKRGALVKSLSKFLYPLIPFGSSTWLIISCQR